MINLKLFVLLFLTTTVMIVCGSENTGSPIVELKGDVDELFDVDIYLPNTDKFELGLVYAEHSVFDENDFQVLRVDYLIEEQETEILKLLQEDEEVREQWEQDRNAEILHLADGKAALTFEYRIGSIDTEEMDITEIEGYEVYYNFLERDTGDIYNVFIQAKDGFYNLLFNVNNISDEAALEFTENLINGIQ